MPRKVFTDEFKQTAVRWPAGGRVGRERGHELGIATWTLRRWMKHAVGTSRKDAAAARDAVVADPTTRLRELESENKRLRQERDILRKAAAFFARDADAEGRA